MREIKFRAREAKTGTWRYDVEVGRSTFWAWIDNGYLDKDTLGQYIGLKDKKRTKEYLEGQEIWEGDIVKNGDGSISKVIWGDGGFLFWPSDIANEVECSESEVLGNLYENPELLKDTPDAKE